MTSPEPTLDKLKPYASLGQLIPEKSKPGHSGSTNYRKLKGIIQSKISQNDTGSMSISGFPVCQMKQRR